MIEKDSTNMRMLVQEDLRYEKPQHLSSQTRHRLNHLEHLAVQRFLHPTTLPGLSLTSRPPGMACWYGSMSLREKGQKSALKSQKKRQGKKSDRHEWYEFCETRHVLMKQRNSAPRFQTRHLWVHHTKYKGGDAY